MDQWRRAAGPHNHGFDEADIFRQINFRDLAAEFEKKKHESFTTVVTLLWILSRPMQTSYAEIFSYL